MEAETNPTIAECDVALFERFELTESEINKLLAHALTNTPCCKAHEMMWRIGSFKKLPALEFRRGIWGTWQFGGGAFTRSAEAIQLIELSIPDDMRDAYCENLTKCLQGRRELLDQPEPVSAAEQLFFFRTASPAISSIAMYLTIAEAALAL